MRSRMKARLRESHLLASLWPRGLVHATKHLPFISRKICIFHNINRAKFMVSKLRIPLQGCYRLDLSLSDSGSGDDDDGRHKSRRQTSRSTLLGGRGRSKKSHKKGREMKEQRNDASSLIGVKSQERACRATTPNRTQFP